MRTFTKTILGGPVAGALVTFYDGQTDEEREAEFKRAREWYAEKMREFRQNGTAKLEET